MKFTLLNQKTYKSDGGADISSDEVEYLSPYDYKFDGFYNWECAKCGNVESSRACGWSISGAIETCRKCNAKNLLVRTNCNEINELFKAKISLDNYKEEVNQINKVLALKYEEKDKFVPMNKVDQLKKSVADLIRQLETLDL